jgi:hypothetical protein
MTRPAFISLLPLSSIPEPLAGTFLKVKRAGGSAVYFTQTMVQTTREFSWCIPTVQVWTDRALHLVRTQRIR